MDTNNNYFGGNLATTSRMSYAEVARGYGGQNQGQLLQEPMTKRLRTVDDAIMDHDIDQDFDTTSDHEERRRKRILKTFENARKNGCTIGVNELCERLMCDTNMWLVEVIDARPRICERNLTADECDRLLNTGHVILIKLNVSIANGIADQVKDTFLELAADVELTLNDLQSAKNELQNANSWDAPMEGV